MYCGARLHRADTCAQEYGLLEGTRCMSSAAWSSARLDCQLPENPGPLPPSRASPKLLTRARPGQWCDSGTIYSFHLDKEARVYSSTGVTAVCRPQGRGMGHSPPPSRTYCRLKEARCAPRQSASFIKPADGAKCLMGAGFLQERTLRLKDGGVIPS